MAYKADYSPILQPQPTTGTRFRSLASYRTLARLVLILSDAVLLALAFGAAYQLRFRFGMTLKPAIVPSLEQYVLLVMLLTPIWIGLFAAVRLYDFRQLLGGTNEYAQVFNACTVGMMFVILVSFFFPGYQISRAWLVLSWILSTLFVSGGRFTLRRIAYRLRDRGYFVSPTVIVGTNAEAVALARQLHSSVSSGLAILGFVSTSLDETEAARVKQVVGLPVLGNVSSLAEIVSRNQVEDVIIATTAIDTPQLMELPEYLAVHPNVELRLSSGLYEIFTTGMRISTTNYVPLMSVNRVRLSTGQVALKSAMDYALILISLPFLLPIFGIISLLIKFDSPGPVFHRRRVMGIGGKEFDALKFRSMVTNGKEILAERPELQAELEANHKLKDDPRVTKTGRWLRRTSLDELPQLFNVLMGQMSLVGPRMITPEEMAEYGQMQFNLLTVKPGLTGLWQVSGRSDLSYDERVQLDMHYIRNYSLWLDLQTLFIQTPPAILKSRGAY